MEEPHDSVRPWLDAGEVGTFDQVAIGTGQGQVLRVVSAAMLPRDNGKEPANRLAAVE